jgi:predicted Zn-dependent protease
MHPTEKDDPISQKKKLSELEKVLNNLTSTETGRRAFLASLPLLLASCSSAPQHRYREGDNRGQTVTLTPDEEAKMTRDVLPEMKKDYPPADNPEAQRYIHRLGDRIVRANALNGRPYQYSFTVVDSKQVNAFALPAGTVFVTAPLIAMADTEAELAGVVGHEIGHVKARHAAERMVKAKKAESKSWLYMLGGGLLGGAAGYGMGKLLCNKEDRECLKKAASLGATAGVGGGLLIQKYAFMVHSREDELEADRVGFKTSVKANYSKDHVGRFYSKLLQMEKKHKGKRPGLLSGLADALSTHPPSEERVTQMNQMARAAGPQSNPRVSSDSFRRIRAWARKIS